MSRRTRNMAFKSKRTSYAPTNFVEAVFDTREERNEYWERQMEKHPDVVRDTTSVDGKTVWRVRWPR